MMETVGISVQTREEESKRANKALRSEGRVPAVLYGLGKDPVSLSVEDIALRRALRSEKKRNIVLQLEGGATDTAMIRDLQVHPVSDQLIHIDFLRVEEGKAVEVDVPIAIVGESPGIEQQGGAIDRPRRTVRIRTMPGAIPTSVEVSIDGLYVGQGKLASDIMLPEGATLVTTGKAPVVVIQSTRATKLMQAEEAKQG